MGHFIDFTKKKNSFGKVISIGVDPFKEILICNECEVSSIDVYDIDEEIITCGNNFFLETNLEISYIHCNVINDEIKGVYNTLFLFQMDYLFSDRELSIILDKIRKTGIKNCYLMTPSMFNLQKGFFPFVFSEFFSIIYLLISNFFKKTNLINSYTTYKRTKRHFIKLLKKSHYVLKSEKTIMNNNGSFNLFHFSVAPDLKP